MTKIESHKDSSSSNKNSTRRNIQTILLIISLALNLVLGITIYLQSITSEITKEWHKHDEAIRHQQMYELNKRIEKVDSLINATSETDTIYQIIFNENKE